MVAPEATSGALIASNVPDKVTLVETILLGCLSRVSKPSRVMMLLGHPELFFST